MSWGTKLGIGMALFISFIVTLGVLMMRSDTDDLVDTDYYEKGIAYDKDYIRKSQVEKDQAQPKIISNGSLKIVFVRPASGRVKFIHPSDKRMDRFMDLKSDSDNQVELPLEQIAKGHWRLLLEWKSDGKAYLFEKELMIK